MTKIDRVLKKLSELYDFNRKLKAWKLKEKANESVQQIGGKGRPPRGDLLLRKEDRMSVMPTILLILGWRLFFYANEGNEPIHVHCRKGDMECKYWLDPQNFDIEEAFASNVSPAEKRQIRKIIYEHYEYIEHQWEEFQGRSRQ